MRDTTSFQKPIRHVVFFSSKKPQDIDLIMTGLSILQQIPHHRHFEVSRNLGQDTFANDVDVVVYAEFESTEQMAAYRAHPIYQKCIEIVRPLREMRIAADF